jgi:periplasmic protein CpxP/Spy
MTMKKILLLFALMTGFVAAGMAQETKMSKAERKAQRKEMSKEIGLTKDQESQLKSMQKENHEKVKAIRADKNLSDAERKERMKSLRQANKQKVQGMLNPEQKEKMKQWRKTHHKKHKQEGKKEGPKGRKANV